MEGSGRCADVIAYAWRLLHEDSPKGSLYNLQKLKAEILPILAKDVTGMYDGIRYAPHPPYDLCPKVDNELEALLNLVSLRDRITVFMVKDTHESLDVAIINSISSVKSMEVGVKDPYQLALREVDLRLTFGHIQEAKDYLARLATIVNENAKPGRIKDTSDK